MALIREPAFKGDLRESLLGPTKQASRMTDAETPNEFADRASMPLTEYAAEMSGIDADDGGEFVEGAALLETFAQILLRAIEPGWPAAESLHLGIARSRGKNLKRQAFHRQIRGAVGRPQFAVQPSGET